MKILVCIKQIPDMESRFKVAAGGKWYDEADLAYRLNEYDEYAVEEAVRLKEQLGGVPDITVISIGSDRVGEALKKALAMGCDRGVHIHDAVATWKDPWQIASMLAAFALDKGFDLIFTGLQSQDRGSAQVGVTLAEILGRPCATTLVGFAYDGGVITGKRELEGGMKGVVRLRTPAVVTCQMGLNVPRYPTLPNIMKAKKKELLTFPVIDLLQEQERTVTDSVYLPTRRGGGVVLEGEMDEQVERLIGILKEKTAVVR